MRVWLGLFLEFDKFIFCIKHKNIWMYLYVVVWIYNNSLANPFKSLTAEILNLEKKIEKLPLFENFIFIFLLVLKVQGESFFKAIDN